LAVASNGFTSPDVLTSGIIYTSGQANGVAGGGANTFYYPDYIVNGQGNLFTFDSGSTNTITNITPYFSTQPNFSSQSNTLTVTATATTQYINQQQITTLPPINYLPLSPLPPNNLIGSSQTQLQQQQQQQQQWVAVEATWTTWNELYRPPQILVPVPPPVNEAELALERERRETRLRKMQTARATARITLLSLLDQPQKEMLTREAAFELRVEDRLYRIRPGSTVQQIEPGSGRVLCSFCIHPYPEKGEWIPEDDSAIAQKLLLEADENLFLQIANRRNYA
jgi:hypothetical protein